MCVGSFIEERTMILVYIYSIVTVHVQYAIGAAEKILKYGWSAEV